MQKIVLILEQDERDACLGRIAVCLLDEKGVSSVFAARLRIEKEGL